MHAGDILEPADKNGASRVLTSVERQIPATARDPRARASALMLGHSAPATFNICRLTGDVIDSLNTRTSRPYATTYDVRRGTTTEPACDDITKTRRRLPARRLSALSPNYRRNASV